MKNFISRALLKIVHVREQVGEVGCRSFGSGWSSCTEAVLFLLFADEDCKCCLSFVPQCRRGPPRRGENHPLCPPGVLDWWVQSLQAPLSLPEPPRPPGTAQFIPHFCMPSPWNWAEQREISFSSGLMKSPAPTAAMGHLSCCVLRWDTVEKNSC